MGPLESPRERTNREKKNLKTNEKCNVRKRQAETIASPFFVEGHVSNILKKRALLQIVLDDFSYMEKSNIHFGITGWNLVHGFFQKKLKS